MIRHIFVGRVIDGVPDADGELFERWRALPALIPEIGSFHCGRNISPRDRRYSAVLVADFDHFADWEVYMDHPDHRAISTEVTSKVIDPNERAAVQLERSNP